MPQMKHPKKRVAQQVVPAEVTVVIEADSRARAEEYGRIVLHCGLDLGKCVRVECAVRPLSRRKMPICIVLHVSASEVCRDKTVWCLSCRVACFCSPASVSVIVHAEGEFFDSPKVIRGKAKAG
jgi:hypothetical protein